MGYLLLLRSAVAKKILAKSPDATKYDELVGLLQENREAKKLSQEKLSAGVGESKNFVQKIEYMQRRVDVVEFYRLAKALSLDPVELFASFVERIEKK